VIGDPRFRNEVGTLDQILDQLIPTSKSDE
jgi:hypothetical protein